MNYAGHEKLRADVAELANSMSDLRDALNDMQHRYRFDSDVLNEVRGYLPYHMSGLFSGC